MKYSSNNKPIQCMMTQSSCYIGTRQMQIKGILWHSTGANNPNIKRYVQPSESDPNCAKLTTIIGKNTNKNDWNHTTRQAGVNAFIGKLADGSIAAVQTMPWNYRPWGCGGGSKGSCNDGWIQFEICEDGLTDKNYFEKVYEEAAQLTAYLCKLYNLDPLGYTTIGSVRVPVILCHNDSYKLGLGSNHGDILHWFPKFDVDMNRIRSRVFDIMNEKPAQVKPTAPAAPTSTNNLKIGDVIVLKPGAKYTSGKAVPNWVINSTLYLREIKKDGNIIFSTLKTGAITGTVSPDQLKISTAQPVSTSIEYKVKVTADSLNIRKGPSTSYAITSAITNKGVYTIVETQGNWGKLKSGAGWICLDYTQKV